MDMEEKRRTESYCIRAFAGGACQLVQEILQNLEQPFFATGATVATHVGWPQAQRPSCLHCRMIIVSVTELFMTDYLL